MSDTVVQINLGGGEAKQRKHAFKSHLQKIFNSRTSAFQVLNIDYIYSSSSIYSKWYCMKATTCLEATRGVSLSFSRQKPALSCAESRTQKSLVFCSFGEVSAVSNKVCFKSDLITIYQYQFFLLLTLSIVFFTFVLYLRLILCKKCEQWEGVVVISVSTL